MSAATPALALPVAIDEDAVRRLCGPATFGRADALQRSGHVLSARTGGDGLTANVRGTWRRIDQVTILARAGKLHPTCTRDGAGFCRHAGALLLHWIRKPASFAPTEPLSPDAQAAVPVHWPVDPVIGESESPGDELVRLLDFDTINHLREFARRRNFRPTGSKKADVVRQVAMNLADPAGIDAALASLTPEERGALDAIHLSSAVNPALPQAIAVAYRVLGGSGEPPVTAAAEAGLALVPNVSYAYDTWKSYLVPRAVAAQLPALDHLARPAREGESAAGSARSSALGVVEMLQVVALEILAGDIEVERPAHGEHHASIPEGLVADSVARHDGHRLVAPTFLAENALKHLATRTGQPRAAVDFVARLMLALDIVQGGPELALRQDHLQALLELPPANRLATLVRAWLATAGPAELGVLTSSGGRLRFRWRPVFSSWAQPMQPPIASASRLIGRLVGRMTPNRWYEVDSLVEVFERLSPTAASNLGQLRQGLSRNQSLTVSLVTNRGKEERLVLNSNEGWSRFLSALINAILTGPMQWLGLVEVADREDGPPTFRVLPAAGVLVDRATDGDTIERPSRLTVGDDLTVLVPAGTTDVSVHGLLARAGELIEASAAGLRYRLTAAGVHAVFDTGTTGPALSSLLAERAGGSLPSGVTAAIDRWWEGYGAIRLYDELTLIELGDDLLQRELMAATPLAGSTIHAYSPRLIAIDPAQAEDLIAALTDSGYAPRVVEEG